MQIMCLIESIATAGCGEDAGDGFKHHKSVGYRQLRRFKMAAAMIDERLKFNQNGAWSIFREVNRLISQALLPPPPTPPSLNSFLCT